MRKEKLRFSIFCLVIFCIVSLPVSQIALMGYVPKTSSIYSFYTTDKISFLDNTKIVKNGNACIVSCDSKHASTVKASINNILGESITINNPNDDVLKQINDYISKNVLYDEKLDGTQIIYGYDNTLKNFVMVDGQKVNFQVAINSDYVVIGYPLILGSF
ncbi:MAG: hypothetical protein ACI4TZ_03310 [Christensenellales bacterium]